eukprot:UN25819
MAGSVVFDNIKRPGKVIFDYCIIDEAAQCTEPDILIPLQLGVESLILVGDPQQLPATVFLQGYEQRLYERSLFQRLIDSGVKNHLLKTQYRMKPEISAFPSSHFYAGELGNGKNVCSPAYDKDYHGNNNLKPFLFFL